VSANNIVAPIVIRVEGCCSCGEVLCADLAPWAGCLRYRTSKLCRNGNSVCFVVCVCVCVCLSRGCTTTNTKVGSCANANVQTINPLFYHAPHMLVKYSHVYRAARIMYQRKRRLQLLM